MQPFGRHDFLQPYPYIGWLLLSRWFISSLLLLFGNFFSLHRGRFRPSKSSSLAIHSRRGNSGSTTMQFYQVLSSSSIFIFMVFSSLMNAFFPWFLLTCFIRFCRNLFLYQFGYGFGVCVFLLLAL